MVKFSLEMGKRSIIRRSDLVLLAAFAGLAAVLVAGRGLRSRLTAGSAADARVQAVQGGEVLGRWPLGEDAVFTVTTEDQSGANVVVIEGGVCRVADADCPDKLCVKRGGISRSGEAIVCLPHKLVVEIVGGESREVDTIAR